MNKTEEYPMSPAIPPDRFRALLRRHAAGVVVITAPGTRPAGFTATSFTSVSLRPPLVSFCLDVGSGSWSVMALTSHVAVHMLGADQEWLARTFASRRIDRFAAPTRWHTGPYGVPILDGASAVLLCEVADRVRAGDHAIVLVQPIWGENGDGACAPLIYHMGRYARAS
jgi:flavin reductase (DIM6/NTAB) family NADH-FMN oxidoreductase RutF